MNNICVIAAHGTRGQIGLKGALPWRIPEELRLFKQVTQGAVVIMGRKTWESLRGPLPGRTNVVISSKPKAQFDGADVHKSLDAALAAYKDFTGIFVIGGKQLFKEAIKVADSAILSAVDYDGPASVKMAPSFFKYIRERFATDIIKRDPQFTCRVYTRLL
jgi:dihydrofolate reductase